MKDRKQQILEVLKTDVTTKILIRFKDGWRKGGQRITDHEANASTATKIIFTKPNHDER